MRIDSGQLADCSGQEKKTKHQELGTREPTRGWGETGTRGQFSWQLNKLKGQRIGQLVRFLSDSVRALKPS